MTRVITTSAVLSSALAGAVLAPALASAVPSPTLAGTVLSPALAGAVLSPALAFAVGAKPTTAGLLSEPVPPSAPRPIRPIRLRLASTLGARVLRSTTLASPRG